MDARREDVLDAPYFHLVFTVPDILNPVIYSNQKLLYDTLYHAASATIQELTCWVIWVSALWMSKSVWPLSSYKVKSPSPA